MNRFKRILNLGLIVSVVGFAGGARLGAREPQAGNANWDNVKELAPGEVIKVVLNDAKSYQGRLDTVSDEGIRVSLPTGKVTFPRQDILRVSYKTGSHRGRNALIGAAIGSAIGIAGAASNSDPEQRAIAWVGVPLLGGAGAGVGAVLPSTAWRDVYRAR